MNFISGLFSSKALLYIMVNYMLIVSVSFLSHCGTLYFTLCNQEIQNKLGTQMLACQDLLRHSQKCAGLMVSVKF